MMKLIICFVFVAVISLPSVSLHGLYDGLGYNYGGLGYNYDLWPQKYVSSVITPPIYDPIKYVSSYVEPRYFGGYNHLNSYSTPLIIYPTVDYNPLPITPISYHQTLYSPIHHYGFGGYKIFGPGLPTHPGYRPPTMWKRIWPPTDGKDNVAKERTSTETPDTTATPETPDTTETPDE